MAAKLIVFENDEERAMMCASLGHNWDSQEAIFGKETKKLLYSCEELFHVSLKFQGVKAENAMLKKIYGIAKDHGLYITWFGRGAGPCEPDRFLVSGHGEERLAFIQC